MRFFARDTHATAATEFAVVAPLILLMIAGITEAGRYFVQYNAVNRLATQYATVWSDCSDAPQGTCAAELATYASSNVVSNISPRLNGANMALSMFQVMMTGTTPTVMTAYPTGSLISPTQIASAQAAFKNGQIGVVVTMTYAHSLDFFPTLMTPALGSALNMSFTVAQLKS